MVVGATDIVGFDVRVRVDVTERVLDAVSVRIDPWAKLGPNVRLAVYVFDGDSENQGLAVGG